MHDEVRAVAIALEGRGVRRGFPKQRLEMARAAVDRGWTRQAVEAAASWLAGARCEGPRLAARLAGIVTKGEAREFRAKPKKHEPSHRCVHGRRPSEHCPECSALSRRVG